MKKKKAKEETTKAHTPPTVDVDVKHTAKSSKVRVMIQDVTIEASSPEELRAKIGEVLGPMTRAMRAAFRGYDDAD